MKKVIILASALLALATLASCENPDVGIQYQLNVSVSARDVVKDLKDVNGVDIFPSGELDVEDYRVRINLFIYDEDGDLVGEKETQIVDDFYTKVEVKKSMNPGEYTLVATADIVKPKGDSFEVEFWKFANTGDLGRLRAVDQNYVGYQYKILGITKKTLEVTKAESLTVDVKPAGAIIAFYFTKLDASKMATVLYEWDDDADYYLIDDETPVIDTTGNLSSDFAVDGKYSGMYDTRYLLPATIQFTWATLTAAEKIINSGTTTFTVKRGVNQILTIDVQGGSAQLKSDTRAPQGDPAAIRAEQRDPAAPQQSLRIIDLP